MKSKVQEYTGFSWRKRLGVTCPIRCKPLIKMEWWHRDRQTDPVERAREEDSRTYGNLTDDVAVKGKGCTIQ